MESTDLKELTGDYSLDPAHTRLGFVARHAMVTKVRGQFHEFSGTAHIDGDRPENSTVGIQILANSIETGTEKRDNHLRTNDFLDIENYPNIIFQSTAIVDYKNGTYAVTGDLTIRGVTKSITFPLEFLGAHKDQRGNTRIGFTGTTTINRYDFNVKWNTALETGGVLVSEKITLEFDISAIRQPPVA